MTEALQEGSSLEELAQDALHRISDLRNRVRALSDHGLEEGNTENDELKYSHGSLYYRRKKDDGSIEGSTVALGDVYKDQDQGVSIDKTLISPDGGVTKKLHVGSSGSGSLEGTLSVTNMPLRGIADEHVAKTVANVLDTLTQKVEEREQGGAQGVDAQVAEILGELDHLELP